MSKNFKKYCYYIVLGLILVFGFLLRLKWLIVNPSFWDDECSLAWNVVHKGYSQFFSVLDFIQVAPPFFMISAKLFTNFFGVSDFTLRLAPFLFGILSMGMFFVISKNIFENKMTVIISNLVFAANSALINYSSEFKQYSCDVFFSLLCLYIFINLLSLKTSFKKNIVYSIILALSIWFSFVSVFVIAAGFITFIFKQIKNKQNNLNRDLILFLPILISCILYLEIYILNTYSSNIIGLSDYWHNSFIAKNLSNFMNLSLNNIKYFLFPSTMILPAILALITGFIVMIKKKPYIVSVMFLTILFECIASWLKFYPFEKRVILFLLPLTLIFISAIFELFNPKEKIKSAFILLIFIAIFIQSFLYTISYIKTPNPTRGYYPREMMAIMLNKIKPNDIIVVNKYSRTDFAYYSTYYNIKNKVIHEGQTGNRQIFLNSLPAKKYYWFYIPFGSSPTFEKWFSDSKRERLFELNSKEYPSKLVYVYVK